MLGVHSCSLGCGNTLTHSVIKTYAHHTALPAAFSLSLLPSPLLFHPSWLRPLFPLVFLSRSLYLPPMAESGRATGSKTCRLQNVGQPSVLSYRLETAVCVCGPLRPPCGDADRRFRTVHTGGTDPPTTTTTTLFPKTQALLWFSSPSRHGWIMGVACVYRFCETNANKSSAPNRPL